jgi:hypothetical protein
MSAIDPKQTFRLRANDFQGYQAPTNAWGGVIWCSEYRNENCLASILMHEPRGLGTDQPCAKRASDLHLVALDSASIQMLMAVRLAPARMTSSLLS